MDGQKPLAVRCAEALGVIVTQECWILQRPTMDGGEWMKLTPCIHGTNCTPIPPKYGEESNRGWACTGPLIERFRLALDCMAWKGNKNYFVKGEDPTGNVVFELEGPGPCAAIAEWVARYVENGQVKNG